MWILDGLKKLKDCDTPAVIGRTGSITFRELWDRSEKLAAVIERTGKKTPVVIYGDKDENIVPAMVAALKTGRAYAPVDIIYPVERLAEIAGQTDACIIFNYSDAVPELPYTVFSKEQVKAVIDSPLTGGEIGEECWVTDQDVCYILFTSGSTGAPKGVPIRRESIMNYVAWAEDLLQVRAAGQNILNQVSYSFDVSVNMLYVYLPTGRTLISVDKGLIEDTGSLLQWMRDHEIAVFTSTPSFADICRKDPQFTDEIFPALKTFNLIGETLTKQTAGYILEHFPDAALYNTYGPTEATVAISGIAVTKDMLDSERTIPIGRMMPDAEWYIEAAGGRRCADGEIGELVVISRSVSTGYFRNPERSAKAFFRSEDGRMGYRTGDNVYADRDVLYFVGRMDGQIKLNGYRIELEDISVNLQKLPMIRRNAVLTAKDAEGKVSYIAACVTLNSEYAADSTLKNMIAIKKGLAGLIPAYMIPRKIVILDEFPVNANGKIDRKVLQNMI